MGSGAFLVGACRYLAAAVEERLVREGRWHRGDVTAADRADVRREVAQRCLFGVDVNPMAVQLARLSLWLATLAADKPLTFLEHRLVAGNGLVGATLDDVLQRPGGPGGRRRRQAEVLPLFEAQAKAWALEHRLDLETLPSLPSRLARPWARVQAPVDEIPLLAKEWLQRYGGRVSTFLGGGQLNIDAIEGDDRGELQGLHELHQPFRVGELIAIEGNHRAARTRIHLRHARLPAQRLDLHHVQQVLHLLR